MPTFRVSDVERVVTRLPAVDAGAQLAALGWKAVEAHQVGAREIVSGPLVNPFVLAVDLAFQQHRPLVITPDAVWMCLAQSLATHIDLNAEQLRSRLVRHEGQLELEQRRDDFIPGDPRNDWPGVVETFAAKIREHLGKRADLFVADFSTTGPLERIASQVALMGAMRQYFRYSVATLCGIPEITLAGTPEDWTSIRRRAAVFDEFDLGWWTKVLDPVLAKLEDTARGKIDHEHWRGFYKMEHASGGERSMGWLNTLFAYMGDPPEPNEFPTIDSNELEGHKLSDFPAGRTRVPFVWRILDERYSMELVAGMWGVTQDEAGALGVATGWLVGAMRTESGFIRSPQGEGWPASLYPRPGLMATLESLAVLEHEAGDEPVSLTLYGYQPGHYSKLRSIDGIEHLRGLVGLSLSGASSLESVAPLANLRGLRELDLRDCPKLRDLGPVLAQLPELETLCLMGNRHLPLDDFRPIAKMTKLTYLVLWHCEALPESIRRALNTPADIENARKIIAEL